MGPLSERAVQRTVANIDKLFAETNRDPAVLAAVQALAQPDASTSEALRVLLVACETTIVTALCQLVIASLAEQVRHGRARALGCCPRSWSPWSWPASPRAPVAGQAPGPPAGT